MRCRACDKNLSDFESTRKNETTEEYEDLCNDCYGSVQEAITDSEDDILDTHNPVIPLEEDVYQRFITYIVTSKPNLISVAWGLVHIVIVLFVY